MIWSIAAVVVVAPVIGLDVFRNPQSYRNIGLRFGDWYRDTRAWPDRLRKTRQYVSRHSFCPPAGDYRPDFMRAWHLL